LVFRSFEVAIPNVVLARKGGIDASKPIKHSCFIENLCKIRSNQAIKVFRGVGRFFKKAPRRYPTNFSYQNSLAAFSLTKQAQRKSYGKRNAVFAYAAGAATRRAVAFEKATENISAKRGCVRT